MESGLLLRAYIYIYISYSLEITQFRNAATSSNDRMGAGVAVDYYSSLSRQHCKFCIDD